MPYALLILAKHAAVAPLTLTSAALWACVLLCLSSAGLAWALQLYYEKGMVLRKYYALITYWLEYKGRRRYVRSRARLTTGLHSMSKSEKTADGWPLPKFFKYERAPQQSGNWIGNVYDYCYFRKLVQHVPAQWYSYLAKPLGRCVYCQAPWLLTLFYVPAVAWLQVPVLLAVAAWPLLLGLQFVFLSALSKIQP